MKYRRLAVIDTKFPWMLSGFRYWENFYIQQQRPDTVFFAIQPHTDPFPAQIHPFTEIEKVIEAHQITDIYCVFLNVALSLIGQNKSMTHGNVPGSNSSWNITELIRKNNLSLHTTLYPGGGLDPGTDPDIIKVVGEHYNTIFTNVDEVSRVIPRSIYIPGIINTQFYKLEAKSKDLPIQLIFCADHAPRKGFLTLVNAFNQLNDDFHLHIVGNWESELGMLTNHNFTYYGNLNPLQLRQLYKKSHVFVNCSTSDSNALDGFPTTAAAEAMATGCLLVSTNVRKDERILRKGFDYFEFDPGDSHKLVSILVDVRDNLSSIQEIGYKSSKKAQTLLDAKSNVKRKLSYMFQ